MPSNKALVSGIYTIERYFDDVVKGIFLHEFEVVNTIGEEIGLIDKINRLENKLAFRAERDPTQIPEIIALYEKYLGGRWRWDERWKEFFKQQEHITQRQTKVIR